MSTDSRKVIVVTGSSQGGIGYALCESFAKRGCRVFATARRLESMEGLKALGVTLMKLDVDNGENCKEVVEAIIEQAGKIDCVVNNAGAGATGALLDFSVDEALKVMNTNVISSLRMAQLVAPHQAKRFKRTGQRGLIVTVGSIVGDIPTPWAGIYATSKAAVHALTNVLRMETAGLGIDVMLVAPGAVKSGFGVKQTASFVPKPDSLYKNVEDLIQKRAMMGQVNATPNTVFAAGVASACLRPQRSILNPLAWIYGTGPPAFYSAGGRWLQFWLVGFFPTWLQFWIMARSTGAGQVGKA